MKRAFILLLCLCLAASMFACASANESKETTNTTAATETKETTEPSVPETTEAAPAMKVDTAKLTNLELADTFPVKVTKIEKIEDGFKQGLVVSLDGDDAIVLTIKNDSTVKIKQVKILVLATDKNGAACNLGLLGDFSIQLEYTYAPETKLLQLDKEIDVGAEFDKGAIRCTFDKVENVNVLVYSYVDENGNEVINKACGEWLVNTVEVAIP